MNKTLSIFLRLDELISTYLAHSAWLAADDGEVSTANLKKKSY